MNTLTSHGTLDITQFWPKGNSTRTRPKFPSPAPPGRFASSAMGRRMSSRASSTPRRWRGAPGSVSVVNKGSVDVRLQAIDAPELHDQPQKYRQPFGEAAAAAMGALVAAAGKRRCRAASSPRSTCQRGVRHVRAGRRRDHRAPRHAQREPQRMGGARRLGVSGVLHLDERRRNRPLCAATEKARVAKKNIWQNYTPQIGPFDPTPREHKPGSTPAPDAGA